MRKRAGMIILTCALLAGAALFVINELRTRQPVGVPHSKSIDDIVDLFDDDREVVTAALERIEADWHPGHTIMLLECMSLIRDAKSFQNVGDLMRRKTGQSFPNRPHGWNQWIWKQPYNPHPNYGEFKARIYARFDARFSEYFIDSSSATIRLDEIVWGGVERDGIPPLKNPKMIAADQADYLDDSNVVFALEINGDARAYPMRILAWHEMVKDTVGGESICGAYCTLCGSMIVYRTEFQGRHHELGTSGLLYRSNKLMYDHATKSLWSTLSGTPVVGPLVGQDIRLDRLDVVTTTWGAWRQRHPDSQVLSLDTGVRRDYREGEAYRSYFATQELMFGVPFDDTRLENKDEVLALRFESSADERLAISLVFLMAHPVYHDRIGDQEFVVISDPTGANRVYDSRGVRFKDWDGESTVVDEDGNQWRLSEAALTNASGRKLERLPAHRAFWFGWHAAFPNTRLVH